MFAPATVEKVLCHLLRFGSSRVDAEDLAQEALLVAWRERERFDPARSLDAWLFGIARNVYRNHARRARRSPVDSSTGNVDDASPTGVPIGDVLVLQRAIQALPETQQDIVILHELEGHTLKETAALLAIPFDTAKDRLRRARATLGATCGTELDAAVAAERPATRRAAKAAVASVLAGVLAAVGRQGTAIAAAGAAGSSVLAAKGVVVAALVAGVVIGAVAQHVVRGRRDSAPTSPIVAQRAASLPPVTAPPAPTPPVDRLAGADASVGSAEKLVPRGLGAKPIDPTAPAPMSADDVAAEAKLVEDARAALRSGRPDDAVVALRTHARRFATGQLAEERDLLWIEAALAVGNAEDARGRLAQFRTAYPATMHGARLDELAARL